MCLVLRSEPKDRWEIYELWAITGMGRSDSSDALPLLRQSSFDDWGFTGPRAALEFLTSVRESTNDLCGYHLQRVKHSGVNSHSSVVREHQNIVEVVRLAISRDQLDVSNLLCFELLIRRVGQLEVVVGR